MKTNIAIFIFYAVLILGSFFLGAMIHPAWLWLSVLLGMTLLQSAFTGFSPVEKLFKAMEK